VDFIKNLKNVAGVSFYDVVYTCFCRAIQDYLKLKSCPVFKAKKKNVKCRSLTPVSIPMSADMRTDKARVIENQWVLVSTKLLLGYDDILEQLKAIHKQSNRMKSSPVAKLQLGIQNHVAPLLPYAIAKKNVYGGLWRHSVTFSVVPGPEKTCLFAGKEGTGLQSMFSNLIPMVVLVSYGGKLWGNLNLDPDAVEDADLIPHLFSKAFETLAERLEVDCPESLISHAYKGTIDST